MGFAAETDSVHLPLPTEPQAPVGTADASSNIPRKVVYVPACVTRMMGPARGDDISKSVPDTMLSLFSKGGFEVVYPKVRPLQPSNGHVLASAFCQLMQNE